MVPIGILTKDRVAYLDVTLRSLSDTELPGDIHVEVYDDASRLPTTQAYYNTNQPVEVAQHWREDRVWQSHGLDIINKEQRIPVGIRDRMVVRRIDQELSLGVVNASCAVITDLMHTYPNAPGVILLQDDVLFNKDWYARMLQTVDDIPKHTKRPVGLLAGIKLNHRFKNVKAGFYESGITAQCLYVSREGFKLCRSFFERNHFTRIRFDDLLRREMTTRNLWAGCIYPFVCQHFGIQSLVRPDKSWSVNVNGRVGYHAKPPYVLASVVRNFRGQ